MLLVSRALAICARGGRGVPLDRLGEEPIRPVNQTRQQRKEGGAGKRRGDDQGRDRRKKQHKRACCQVRCQKARVHRPCAPYTFAVLSCPSSEQSTSMPVRVQGSKAWRGGRKMAGKGEREREETQGEDNMRAAKAKTVVVQGCLVVPCVSGWLDRTLLHGEAKAIQRTRRKRPRNPLCQSMRRGERAAQKEEGRGARDQI